jgi:hypothetical protein
MHASFEPLRLCELAGYPVALALAFLEARHRPTWAALARGGGQAAGDAGGEGGQVSLLGSAGRAAVAVGLGGGRARPLPPVLLLCPQLGEAEAEALCEAREAEAGPCDGAASGSDACEGAGGSKRGAGGGSPEPSSERAAAAVGGGLGGGGEGRGLGWSAVVGGRAARAGSLPVALGVGAVMSPPAWRAAG